MLRFYVHLSFAPVFGRSTRSTWNRELNTHRFQRILERPNDLMEHELLQDLWSGGFDLMFECKLRNPFRRPFDCIEIGCIHSS